MLWSDHLVGKIDLFKKIIVKSSKFIKDSKDKIIFIGQKPRFSSQNLGWIKYGKILKKIEEMNLHSFEGFYYRPELNKAKQFLEDGNYAWNLGYFVTTIDYLWDSFAEFQPEIFTAMKKIYESLGSAYYSEVLDKIYHELPSISFDNAILEKINKKSAYVVCEDIKWSDVGAWEALKEALQTSPSQNIVKGKVLVTDCQDCLVYNYTDKLVVTLDLDGHIVINTNDVLLIGHKHSVPKIKKLVEGLKNSGDEHLI